MVKHQQMICFCVLPTDYDDNGNMTDPDTQDIDWDAENRPVAVSGDVTAAYVYDGDGNRVKKTENGVTTLYINRYFEVDLSTSTNTSFYYLGNKLVATSENETLRYVHQDHLSGTSLMTDSSGELVGTTMNYLPFGAARSGSVPTDKLFTGQRLDATGLYYYNARYYDPQIGRFISTDRALARQPGRARRQPEPVDLLCLTLLQQCIISSYPTSNGVSMVINCFFLFQASHQRFQTLPLKFPAFFQKVFGRRLHVDQGSRVAVEITRAVSGHLIARLQVA